MTRVGTREAVAEVADQHQELTVEALEKADISAVTVLNCLMLINGGRSRDSNAASRVINATGCRLSTEPLFEFLNVHQSEVLDARAADVQEILALVGKRIHSRQVAVMQMAEELEACSAGCVDDSGGIVGSSA